LQVSEPSPTVNGQQERKRPSSAASAGERGEKRRQTVKSVCKVIHRKSEIRRKALTKEVSGYWRLPELLCAWSDFIFILCELT
jgi:hypothetical protein